MKTHPLALLPPAIATLMVVASMHRHDMGVTPNIVTPLRQPELRQRSSDLEASARQMAVKPRGEIAHWLSTLPLSERDKALSILVAESGKFDPLLAMDHALQIQAPALRAECAGLAIAYLYELDPQGALKRMKSETHPAIRGAMEKRLIPALAENHAEDAVGLLATGAMDDAAYFPTLVATVVQRWGQRDPLAAAGWITTIEEPGLRANAAAALAAVWMHRNPAQMDEWLSAHADQPNVADLLRARPDWTSLKKSGALPDSVEAYAPDDTVVSEPCDDDAPEDDS